MKKIINTYLNSFRSIALFLILITIISFSLITYSTIQDKLYAQKARAQFQISTVENFIDLLISNAQQVVHGLAVGLVNEPLAANNKNINKLVENFNNNLNHYTSIPFYGFKVLNAQNFIIYHTMIPPHIFVPFQNIYDLDLLEQIKKKSFSSQVGKIRFGTISNELIIPFCTAINSIINNEYLGSICTGLKVSEFNKQISHLFFVNYYDTIILKKSTILSEENQKQLNIDQAFILNNLLKSYFINQDIIIDIPLKKYPFVIEAKLNIHKPINAITIIIYHSLAYFTALFIFIYLLYIAHKKYYYHPLHLLREQILQLPDHIISQQEKLELPKLDWQHLPNALHQVINHYTSLCAETNNRNAKNLSTTTLHDNILYLILIERHSNSSMIENITHLSSLYLLQLKKLINEEKQEMNLFEFLRDTKKYCTDYHKLTNVELSITEKNYQTFTFKHAALSETIFHLFTLLTRISGNNIKKYTIKLSGIFEDGCLFPTISIQIKNFNQPLNWTSGTSYIHNGFLSVYSLARYNNLLFNITDNGEELIFTLEPIANEIFTEVSKKHL